MQLADRIHLVGSGANGFGLTDPYDCHIYLLDGGSELALIDVGAGMGAEQVLENIVRAGFDARRIRQILCTHAHGDHSGGAMRMRERLPEASVSASEWAGDLIRRADADGMSIDAAKAAGIYPFDYVLEPCPVDRELADGDRVEVGDLVLECIATPGHARGHLSFLLDHGGTLLLQAIHDCRLEELVVSLRKVRPLGIDALYPGHFTLSVHDGQRHLERANAVLDTLLVPPQAVAAW
jgi:glyoxylase-like metal-dependent hydrolase (beta-lactamase superfamily II)